jgi:hypothetical protein
VGHNGDWKYHKNWVAEGEVAEGLGWDTRYVRLHDMNGDGKAGKFNIFRSSFVFSCADQCDKTTFGFIPRLERSDAG